MKAAPPIYTHKRNSSIELYRIIATFAVLIVHFNGWFVGGVPDAFDFSSPSYFRIVQMVISALTCICVNMFIIISGYFGIKLRLSSIFKLCFYLAVIYVPFYLVQSIIGDGFNTRSFISKFFVISNAGYFIQCYFVLMILSPVLNSFIDKFGKSSLKWVILFWVLEIWFGYVRNIDAFGYNHGYSVIHFVLIYMIARCIRLYRNEILRVKPILWVAGYLVATVFIICCYLLGLKNNWDYSNPIVVISSICTFLPFLYRNFYSKTINWIAGGTLAVYIIQVTTPAKEFLIRIDNKLLASNSYIMYLILVFLVIIITFLFSVLYGKICEEVSGKLTKRFLKKDIVFDGTILID